MSNNPLQQALAHFERMDSMGGFETIAGRLFPGWTPKHSCKAPQREDKSPSFSVYRNEGEQWRFKDYTTGVQGSLLGFVMLGTGLDTKGAARWLIEQAGIGAANAAPFSPRREARSQAKPETIKPLPLPIPDAAQAAWFEGVAYAEAHPDQIERLNEWRGWPQGTAQELLAQGGLSLPDYFGRRGTAFLVQCPSGTHGGLITCGYHLRLKGDDNKGTWRFVPSEKNGGYSIPALPFVIGKYSKARWFIALEGQWDAITLSVAAGWFDPNGLWPENVCVLGIRGASGVQPVFDFYLPVIRQDARFLLIGDSDKAGASWHEGKNSFAFRLSQAGFAVKGLQTKGYKDFNDLYRADKPTKEQVLAALREKGIFDV
jgi:hypothetical protein